MVTAMVITTPTKILSVITSKFTGYLNIYTYFNIFISQNRMSHNFCCNSYARLILCYQ